MNRGNSCLGLPPICGELHLPSKSPLQYGQPPFMALESVRAFTERLVRQRRKAHDSNVDTDSRTGVLVDRLRDFALGLKPVSYTHLRAHETDSYLVCRLLLAKNKHN